LTCIKGMTSLRFNTRPESWISIPGQENKDQSAYSEDKVRTENIL
jgi:hypothetical protein